MNLLKVDFEQINLDIKNRTYKHIGSGSGRQVFDLENGYVVKMGRNKKGIAQNEAEFQIASTNKSDFLAKIPQASDNFKFIIMEKADKVRSITSVWKYYNVKNNKELFELKELKDIYTQNNLLLPDLYRPDNWGRIGERLVIIDYGFTWKVKRKYYFPF